MKIIDGIILAQTKNRAHRIRNWISVVVSSLLFGALFFGAIVVSGALQSAEKYQDLGFNNHFLATAELAYMASDSDEFYKQAKKAADQDLEGRGIEITDEVLDSDEYRWHIYDLQREFTFKKMQQIDKDFRQETKEKYRPIAKYEFRYLMDFADEARAITNDADPLLSGAKTALKNRTLQEYMSQPVGGYEGPEFALLDDKLAKNMLASGQNTKIGDDGAIPIFMAYKGAADFSSVKYDGKDLSTAEINQKYRELANDVTGKIVEYCYRNKTASDVLVRALEYNYQLEKTKSTEKPIAIESCAPINDKRLNQALPTDSETKEKPLFPKSEKDPEIAPITKTLKFRIVGFAPYDNPREPNTLLANINPWPNMGSSFPMIIPLSAANDENLKQIIGGNNLDGDSGTYIYDFANRDDQRSFVASGCQGWSCGSKGFEYRIQSFGNISVALESVIDGVKVTVSIIAAIVIFIAMITIMAIIGKTIGESRREIAIFRALGARRRDIAQIYVGFGLILTFRALLLAFIIAIVSALIVSYRFADDFNAQLISATGAYTSDISSSLVGFDMLWLLAISGALILAALLGLILPIAMGTRRKLIDQLREE